jgi:arylamine N-acetyltransferase
MGLPVAAILAHLELTALDRREPDRTLLDRVLLAWSARIPWESASRIVRRQSPGAPEDYARGPERFFADALRFGSGGTCFESNGALCALLAELGFSARIVFCDMDDGHVDPHCALIVALDGESWLADVGYPIPAALRLDPAAPTAVEPPVYRYTAEPLESGEWEVRRTSGSWGGFCFRVRPAAIDPAAFQARLVRDHGPDGLFLEEVILHRVDGNQVWYFSEHRGLVRRTVGREDPLLITDLARPHLDAVLSRFFRVDRALIRAALTRSPLENGR